MKKLLSLSLLMLVLALLPSCGKEKDEPSGSSLEGTSWIREVSGTNNYLILEFSSSSKVEGYVADSSGNPLYSRSEGSYKLENKTVTFSGFSVKYVTFVENFTSADIAGNYMKVRSWWEMAGVKYENSVIFTKQ